MGADTPARRIQAAGGVLWRDDDGPLRVALIHRDRYDDWSLPKGKREPGELALAAALREVREETGSHVAPSRRLGQVRYRVGGVEKLVWYWTLRYLDGTFAPSEEVDSIVWLEPAAATCRLSYAGDRKMLSAFTASAVPTSAVLLIRHAKAGKRSEWDGPDQLRPLERTGWAQATAIAELGRLFDPVRIVSAQLLRCQQTVQPLAAHLKLPVEIDSAFSDEQSARDLEVSRTALAVIVASGLVVAVCSQGDTMQALLGKSTAKASAWLLGCRDGQIVSADYYGAAGQRATASGH